MLRYWIIIKGAFRKIDQSLLNFILKFPWIFCTIAILLISWYIVSLICLDEKLNRIAEKSVDIEIFAMGNVDAKMSNASIFVNMDYWGIDSIPYNCVTITHNPERRFGKDTVANVLRNVFKSAGISSTELRGFIIDSISSIYVVKYKMFSDEISNFRQKEYGYRFLSHTAIPSKLTIINTPHKTLINGKTCIEGDYSITFGDVIAREQLCFNTNVDNQYPNYNQIRNLSALRLKTNISSNIPIDTIEFNFYGGARYADIIPLPDYKNSQYIRYISSEKINYILREGLDIECEFKQAESRQNIRTAIIWLLISTLVGFVGYVVHITYSIFKSKKR